MDASNMVTAGLLFLAFIVIGASCLCRYLVHDNDRYAIGSRRALCRLAKKLNHAIHLPRTSTNLGPVEMALGTSLSHFEDITGKIKDDAARAQVELSFMVVRGAMPGLPLRICVDDTIFCFDEDGYNQQAVLKSLKDFNNSLSKVSKS